jgi:IS30 family transposase
MSQYHHFTLEEREKIACFQRENLSLRAMAQALNRSPSSISREIRRNQVANGFYIAEFADKKSKDHRHVLKPRVLHRQKTAAAKDYILEKLKLSWTPDEISGRMRREKQSFYACPETIYKFIYSQEGRDLKLFSFLKRKQKTRYFRHSKRPVEPRVAPGASVHDRPKTIENRRNFGHFEGDLVICKNGNIATLLERKTRMAFLIKNDSKHSDLVISGIQSALAMLPEKLRRSLSLDQGTEFALYQRLEVALGIKIYFCDTHSPWQKGANENFNGRLRHFLPKKSDISTLTQADLDQIAEQMNNTPRKCLGYKTPKEAFSAALRTRCTSS